MVLYRVHSEPSLDKYYSTICSRATIFQIVIYATLIIPAFFIAYSTNGELVLNNAHLNGPFIKTKLTDFWLYTSSYKEQPDVNYLNQLFIQISGADGTSVPNTWSTLPNLNALLQADEVTAPVVKVRTSPCTPGSLETWELAVTVEPRLSKQVGFRQHLGEVLGMLCYIDSRDGYQSR